MKTNSSPVKLPPQLANRFPQRLCDHSWQALQAIGHSNEEWNQLLDHPIEFPSLGMAIVPGDQVAIAVSPGVPQVEVALESVVKYLLQQSVPPTRIQVVLASSLAESRDRFATLLNQLGIDDGAISVHDGQDLHLMEYLAADDEALPIYLNRVLAEADVILPLAVLRPPGAYDYFGPQGIVPWFLDDATQSRCRSVNQDHPTIASLARTEQGQHISRLAGVSVVVGSLPLSPNETKRWVCGPPDVLLRLSESPIAEPTWEKGSAPNPLDFVLAIVDEPQDQNWETVGRIVMDVGQSLPRGGTLVLCTSLSQSPKGALKHLASSDDFDRVEGRLLKSDLPYRDVALALFRMRHHIHIYLMANLSIEAIEDLGIGAIQRVEEIERLASHARNGVYVPHASLAYLFPSDASSLIDGSTS